MEVVAPLRRLTLNVVLITVHDELVDVVFPFSLTVLYCSYYTPIFQIQLHSTD